MTRTIVFYHYPCTDGLAAAWAAHKSLGDEAEYVPINYGDDFNFQRCNDREVIFLDFSLKAAGIKLLSRHCERLLILDHHKTAVEEFKQLGSEAPNCTIVFDMEKSGCHLAWEHFHPGKEMPRLLRYIEDRDLWRFQLPDSKLINDWIRLRVDDSFGTFRDLVLRMSDGYGKGLDDVWDEARGIRLYKDKLIGEAVGHAHLMELGDPSGSFSPLWSGYGVNMPCSDLISEVGEKLALRATEKLGRPAFGACYFRVGDKWAVSLRSRGELDVSEIAKFYGGGGHKNAAGFHMNKAPEVLHLGEPEKPA